MGSAVGIDHRRGPSIGGTVRSVHHQPGLARHSLRVLSVGVIVALVVTGLNGPVAADPPPGPGDPRAPLPSGPTTAPSVGPSLAPQIAAAAAVPAPGTYVGYAFDACTAPTSAQMQAWADDSFYEAVGIYFGGLNRGCTQPELTPAWVAEQQAAGWALVPLYVGLQAPCTTSTKPYLIDPSLAAAQGRAQAEDAALQANSLGLGQDSTLIFDMEAYDPNDTACTATVNTFMNAWTRRLHDLGFLSGFYSSMDSGVRDQVAAYAGKNYAHPDYLDFARWDGIVTISDPAIPNSYWWFHQRIKQYQGGHDETHGGVTLNVDNDYVDVSLLRRTPFGDRNGNGWSDVLARVSSNGNLYLYPGDGTGLASPLQIGSGWNVFNAIVRHGDYTGDGYEDLFARETATGYLWRYPGAAGGGFGARTRHGSGWNTMREITAIGDLTGDGRNDLVAVGKATGRMYLYPGPNLTTRTALGVGWNTMDELTGIGDFTRDSQDDLIAREKTTGNLWLYPGQGGTFPTRTRISTADWSGPRDISAVGDFNRDHFMDMIAVQKSTGYMYRYLSTSYCPACATVLTSGILFNAGWSGLAPVL
jgi:hypothetical protein